MFVIKPKINRTANNLLFGKKATASHIFISLQLQYNIYILTWTYLLVTGSSQHKQKFIYLYVRYSINIFYSILTYRSRILSKYLNFNYTIMAYIYLYLLFYNCYLKTFFNFFLQRVTWTV